MRMPHAGLNNRPEKRLESKDSPTGPRPGIEVTLEQLLPSKVRANLSRLVKGGELAKVRDLSHM